MSLSVAKDVQHYVQAWNYKERLPLVEETTAGGTAFGTGV